MTQDDDIVERTNAEAQQEAPQADASIDLRTEKGDVLINVHGEDRSNRAVHFAHWIGENLAALQQLAMQDLLAQQRIHDQAKAIAQLTKPEEGRPVIELPVRALRGPDGGRLQ